jgi:2-oxoglutarate dehydrogenase E2 component (dihydrolipoamide succinyltransferase)
MSDRKQLTSTPFSPTRIIAFRLASLLGNFTMALINLTVPSPGESITEVTLGTWHKAEGDWAEKDDLLVEIESDKATLELLAPQAGRLSIAAKSGAEVPVGAVVGMIDTAAKPEGKRGDGAKPAPEAKAESKAESKSVKTPPPPKAEAKQPEPTVQPPAADAEPSRATTVARKMAADHGVDLGRVQGSGPAGRIMKSDVMAVAESGATPRREGGDPGERTQAAPSAVDIGPQAKPAAAPAGSAERGVRREKMTKLRQRIAERLVEAQHTAAMLTTFNECDMSEVLRLRSAHKEAFEKAHGVGLGFMSFFVKAAVSALKKYPRVNAYIVPDESGRPAEMEHHDFVDVAVAVGTDRGLVVPVLRNADRMSFADIERTIKELATKARDGKLTVDEMTGGTFTITNGGVYGSLMSTPILNPPQSGILGMHAMKNRAVEDPRTPGQIVLRPMMYLALSYDHRMVDGAEAVGFLVHIKQCIESPERLLLGM